MHLWPRVWNDFTIELRFPTLTAFILKDRALASLNLITTRDFSFYKILRMFI